MQISNIIMSHSKFEITCSIQEINVFSIDISQIIN